MGSLSSTDLVEYINKKFTTNYSQRQMSNKISYIQSQKYGISTNDAERLLKKLILLKEQGGGEVRYEKDRENRLSKLFFCSQKMIILYKSFYDVIFVDTTFQKNRFNMPILCIVGFNNYGHNILLGFGLLNDSTEKSFNWAFESFSKIVDRSPQVIFSDQEKALRNSLKVTFPEARHLLCGWHVARNLTNRFKAWKAGSENAQKLFNYLKYLPFTKDSVKFERRVTEIKEFLANSNENLNYFENAMKNKYDFAICYVKNVFCGAVNTTSRVESLNNILSTRLTSKSKLQEVVEAFEKIEKAQFQSFNEIDRKKQKTKINVKVKVESNPELSALSYLYSDYAIQKFIIQEDFITSYSATKLPSTYEEEIW